MNEYQSPFSLRSSSGHPGGGHHHHQHQNKPQVVEDTLRTDKIQVERKMFVISLKENPRGRFLRITEDVNGRRDTIIVPATGLLDFKRVIDEMVQASEETPPKEG
jgi:hypothetical protein